MSGASVTITANYDKITTGTYSRSGGSIHSGGIIAMPSDKYAVVFLTSWTGTVGVGGSAMSAEIYNSSSPPLKFPVSVSGSGASGSSAYMAPGVIFLAPGDSLFGAYVPSSSGDSVTMNFSVYEFYSVTKL